MRRLKLFFKRRKKASSVEFFKKNDIFVDENL